MKSTYSAHIIPEQPIALTKGQVLSISENHISIDCLSGIIWITWPDGNERTLQEGQSCSILSEGKICLSTFNTARVAVQHRSKPAKPGLIPKMALILAILLRKGWNSALLPWNFA